MANLWEDKNLFVKENCRERINLQSCELEKGIVLYFEWCGNIFDF